MPQEFFQVNPNDWHRLNMILRRIFELLDAAAGYSKAFVPRKGIDMDGNAITNGPSQTAIDATDFVTKSYLSSEEAGRAIVQLLRTGGKTPLPGLVRDLMPRQIYDNRAIPLPPDMKIGELVILHAVAADRHFLVHYDGTKRRYWEVTDTDLY